MIAHFYPLITETSKIGRDATKPLSDVDKFEKIRVPPRHGGKGSENSGRNGTEMMAEKSAFREVSVICLS